VAKKITISVPDEMYRKLRDLKEELSEVQIDGKRVSRKISGACQKALVEVIEAAEASRAYRSAGLNDGSTAVGSLSERDKSFIVKVLSGDGPYRKWSRFERMNVLSEHFDKDMTQKILTPRFKDLMDGKITLDAWVEQDPGKVEDRRGEMCWSYIEGCFEGAFKEITREGN